MHPLLSRLAAVAVVAFKNFESSKKIGKLKVGCFDSSNNGAANGFVPLLAKETSASRFAISPLSRSLPG